MANANIFAQFLQPVRSMADYADAADERDMRRESMAQQRRQSAIQQLMAEREQKQYETAQGDQDLMQRIMQSLPKDASRAQAAAALRATGRMALMQRADAEDKADTDRRLAQATIDEKTASKLKTDLGYMRQLAGGVFANPTQENAVMALQEWTARTGQNVDRDLQAVQKMTNPAEIKQYFAAKAYEADKFLPKLTEFTDNKRRWMEDTNVLTNPAGVAPITMTTTPDADLSANTSRANNAASIAAQIRGQNMADARQREATAATREGNATAKELALQERELKVGELRAKADDRAKAKDAAIFSAGNQIAVIDKALTHPGRTTATGLSGSIDPRNYVPGTDATDFRTVLDQIGGSAFLQAFESLKGGGAITEVEGQKATAAIARLNRAQSDKEFKSSLDDLREVMTTGYKRMSGREYERPAPKTPTAPKPAAGGKPNVSNW